jgi:hypothetical protein
VAAKATAFRSSQFLGQAVRAGQPLLLLESMKIEVPLDAPCDAVVAAIHAGWRGVAADVVQSTIAEIRRLDPRGRLVAAGAKKNWQAWEQRNLIVWCVKYGIFFRLKQVEEHMAKLRVAACHQDAKCIWAHVRKLKTIAGHHADGDTMSGERAIITRLNEQTSGDHDDPGSKHGVNLNEHEGDWLLYFHAAVQAADADKAPRVGGPGRLVNKKHAQYMAAADRAVSGTGADDGEHRHDRRGGPPAAQRGDEEQTAHERIRKARTGSIDPTAVAASLNYQTSVSEQVNLSKQMQEHAKMYKEFMDAGMPEVAAPFKDLLMATSAKLQEMLRSVRGVPASAAAAASSAASSAAASGSSSAAAAAAAADAAANPASA